MALAHSCHVAFRVGIILIMIMAPTTRIIKPRLLLTSLCVMGHEAADKVAMGTQSPRETAVHLNVHCFPGIRFAINRDHPPRVWLWLDLKRKRFVVVLLEGKAKQAVRCTQLYATYAVHPKLRTDLRAIHRS